MPAAQGRTGELWREAGHLGAGAALQQQGQRGAMCLWGITRRWQELPVLWGSSRSNASVRMSTSSFSLDTNHQITAIGSILSGPAPLALVPALPPGPQGIMETLRAVLSLAKDKLAQTPLHTCGEEKSRPRGGLLFAKESRDTLLSCYNTATATLCPRAIASQQPQRSPPTACSNISQPLPATGCTRF